MKRSFDVIVLGLGAMGTAACRHLAERGKRVLGLERFSIPHSLGSSHGDSRVTRLSYYEHPDYVPLLLRAYELWEQLQTDSGRTVWQLTGGVYMGPETGAFVQGSLDAARAYDLPHEALELADLRRRWPVFRVAEDFAAIYEPRAGLIYPEVTVAANAELALRLGAELRGCEPVRRWESSGGSVTVESELGRYEAGQLIICAGAWSPDLLRDLGLPLSVSRQCMGWIWPRDPDRFALGGFPVWAMEDELGLRYGFPLLQNRPGLKIARHYVAAATTPETIDRRPTEADRREILDLVDQAIPDAAGPLLSVAVCMYTNTPDGHFIVDHHPDHENVLLACGFSGHGFKFVPVIGEVLADLATQGSTDHPIDFLRLSRLQDVPPGNVGR